MQYRAGSLIYFQGDPAERVFILQSGKVNLRYQNIETGEDVRDLVQPGEFFGVKSALGRYPREENAIAMQDAVAMAFTVPEFEALAAANTRIIMKMLKVFSNQMRRIHAQVSSLLTKEGQQNPEDGLFTIGQFYFKNRRFSQASYILSRYLTYYPAGRFAQQAAQDLEAAERSLGKSGGASGSAAPAPSASPGPAAQASGSDASGSTDTAKAYYDAVSLISQQKYQHAYLSFKKIVDGQEDPEYVAKSFFEMGRCLFFMNKIDDCIKYFTMMITKYPKHPDLTNALYYMGQSYEKNNDKYRAAVFYKKLLSMPGGQDDGVRSKATQALKALEG
jgi:CRP-like cAMP-binding protein